MKIFQPTKVKMRSFVTIAMFLLVSVCASAFTGTDPVNGKKYYLYNIYQAKFLGANSKLDNNAPLQFDVTSNAIKIGATTWTLSKNGSFYQLKSGSSFFAFEPSVEDTNYPGDENRRKYLGGGVTCQASTVDNDRTYWQIISQEEYDEYVAKKKFTVASLNVDGMPKSVKVAGVIEVKLNEDAKEGPGATAIGERLLTSGYDVVGVSEDFNYHSELWDAAWNNGSGIHYNATTHRGSISAGLGAVADLLNQNPVLDSDGLCLFYRIDGSKDMAIPSNESWTKWNEHFGYTDSGADGLINKGYRYYLITLADGTQFDLYVMHMDAGSDSGDNAARASQLTQLANAIKATSNKRPIIIIGDTNCRYTRDNIKGLLIDAINADSRFTIRDPWIEYGRNKKYPAWNTSSIMASEKGYLQGEVVDKIFYINNTDSDIRLVAESYCQDLSFVDADGEPLCDHKPCVVSFSYHKFDASIDDKPVDETSEAAQYVYLRNRETGRFLKAGGQWGTHAVVGNYAMPFMVNLENGKYSIQSHRGYLSMEGDEKQVYVDAGASESRAVKDFELVENDGYYMFVRGEKALSANDPYHFNDSPNYRWVIFDNLDKDDKLQQWEIVTEEMMNAEIAKATPDAPINVTHLLYGANFDRGDETYNSKWVYTNTGTVTNNGLGGLDDDSQGNFHYMITTANKTSKHSWKLKQTLNGLPNGWYVVTCQGFTAGRVDVSFYAGNDEGWPYVNFEYDTDIGSDRANIARAFNENKYQNIVQNVHVANGMLEIGVQKSSNKYASTTAIDNFQLYYLGIQKPTANYAYDVIGSTRKAELASDGSLKLTGTWREVDMKAPLANAPQTGNLSAVISEKKPLAIDASADNYFVCRPEIVMPTDTADNANMVIRVANANELVNTTNVIDAQGKCANFSLVDKKDFAPNTAFSADKVTYSRTNTQGYNTVCMPFDIKMSDFPSTCTVYTYKETGTEVVKFTEVEGDAVIPAGTPVLVKDEASKGEWDMTLASRSVVDTATGNDANTQVCGLNGSFVKRNIGAGYYKLDSTGDKFGITTSAGVITPFRFYLNASTSGAKLFGILFDEDDANAISNILDDSKTTIEETYDLNGHKVLNITHPGIYIKNGKKVFVK